MDIDTIAGLSSQSGSLISLYVAQGNALSARLTDLLKPVRERAEEGARTMTLSVRADVEKLGDLAGRLARDPAAGFAMFASDADGVFEVVPLSAPPPDFAVVATTPYLRPLRVLRPPLHGAAIVIERAGSDAYEMIDNQVLDAVRIEAEPGKRNYGGFKGFDEHRVQRHAEEEVGHMLRQVAERLLRRHQDAPFDFLAFGGHQETYELLRPHLHQYLAGLPHHRFVIDPNTATKSLVAGHLADAAAVTYRAHDEELVRMVLEGRHHGAHVALGSPEVLDAVNLKAAEHLVISGPIVKSGFECVDCGWLARSAASCGSCGGTVRDVDDVLGPAIERVLEASGEVTQVEVASPLDAMGVGALLRFAM